MTISRRKFLQSTIQAAGATALANALEAGAGTQAADGRNQPPSRDTAFHANSTSSGIRFEGSNGIVVEVGIEAKRVRGIGTVTLAGKPLRSTREWIWPEIATPYGREVAWLEYLGHRTENGALIIAARPYFRVGHAMEWMQQDMHPIVDMASWSAPPDSPPGSLFEWILREVNEVHDGVDYRGFSYSFHYKSPGRPIYQIHDKATWELGGDAVGNGWIIRGGNEPHTVFDAKTQMYSGWDFARSPNPHIFQHKPLYTQLQGFTFQYDGEHVLLTVHERPSHVRSVFLRLADDPRILHLNQFCFGLTEEHTTPARKVMAARRKGSGETSLRNHYLRVRDDLQQQHRKYYGLSFDRTAPCSHLECQGLAAIDKYPAAFEQLRNWGIRRAFIMPIWRSPDTDINPVFEKQKGKFGVFGNLCCPLELEIADLYGGWDGFEKLMRRAEACGLATYTWHASHFSSITPLVDRIPDLFCRDQAGQNNRNNYGHVLWAVNQKSEKYQEYLLNTYRKAKQLGLKGIFHDSHFNLATDTINFLHGPYGSEDHAPDGGFAWPSEAPGTDEVHSMHDVCLELQRRLQNEVGLFYMVESEGALGTPQTAPDYAFVRGNEWIYSNMESAVDLRDLERCGDDPLTAYFRGMSTRLMYQVAIDPGIFPSPGSVANWWRPETMVPLNHAFARVEPAMEEMWVMDQDKGVEWRSDRGRVIFAYKDFQLPLPERKTVLDAVADREFSTDSLEAKRLGIYLIRA